MGRAHGERREPREQRARRVRLLAEEQLQRADGRLTELKRDEPAGLARRLGGHRLVRVLGATQHVERVGGGGGRFGPGQRGEHRLASLLVPPDEGGLGIGRFRRELRDLVRRMRLRRAGREGVAGQLKWIARGATGRTREGSPGERNLVRGGAREGQLQVIELRPAAHQLDRADDGAVVADRQPQQADGRDATGRELQRPRQLLEARLFGDGDGVDVDPRALELGPHRLGARVDSVGHEPAALVRDAGDHHVGLREPRRALDDRRERRVEVADSGRFPGRSHVAP